MSLLSQMTGGAPAADSAKTVSDADKTQPVAKPCPFTVLGLAVELEALSLEGAEMLGQIIESGQLLPPPMDVLNPMLPEVRITLHLFTVFGAFNAARLKATVTTAKAATKAT